MIVVVDGKLVEADEPRFFLDEDSICYGCQCCMADGGCNSIKLCDSGDMNSYRMEG